MDSFVWTIQSSPRNVTHKNRITAVVLCPKLSQSLLGEHCCRKTGAAVALSKSANINESIKWNWSFFCRKKPKLSRLTNMKCDVLWSIIRQMSFIHANTCFLCLARTKWLKNRCHHSLARMSDRTVKNLLLSEFTPQTTNVIR